MNPMSNVKGIERINKREIELGLAGTSNSWHAKYKDSAWVFIGGLPYDLTEGDVICVFSQYGEIVNINLVRDKKTGKIMGYGFLCYEDTRSAILAVDNLNGIKLLGRTIRVDHVENYRKPKELENATSDLTKLREEGCAPKLPSPVKDNPEKSDLIYIKEEKKSKKKKKEKSKKKKKEKKLESISGSHSSDNAQPVNKRSRSSPSSNLKAQNIEHSNPNSKNSQHSSSASRRNRTSTSPPSDPRVKDRMRPDRSTSRSRHSRGADKNSSSTGRSNSRTTNEKLTDERYRERSRSRSREAGRFRDNDRGRYQTSRDRDKSHGSDDRYNTYQR